MDDKDFGQMLHAKELGFVHPITHEFMMFTAEPPQKFYEILAKYRDEIVKKVTSNISKHTPS